MRFFDRCRPGDDQRHGNNASYEMKKMAYHRLLITLLVTGLAACAQPASNQATTAPGPNTLNVADAAIAGGDPAMALSVSQAVLQSDPNNLDALIHEGDAYYALQRCPDAIAAYTLALNFDPKSSAAETGLGRCEIKTDPKAAEVSLLRAIQDDPQNAAALNDLGIARDLQGNFAGAIGPYQQALLADPGVTAVEVNLGLSLALSGNSAEALQYLGPLAMSPDATPKIRQNYAAALVASGRDADARQVLNIDLPPDQVKCVLAGFTAVIAGAQQVIPSAEPKAASIAPAVPVKTAALTPVVAVPMAAMTSPAPPPATRIASSSQADVKVQLGSLNSVADAQSGWSRMQ
jgi:Flp pilus assembly protein TadD